ncbi:MAG: NPCBM/NEW2 domain-containing protein, partial [Planctomycetes bacterium]|nr:NPCBM/NEW2 domain-containing protein [Planctomycetota bacterium]
CVHSRCQLQFDLSQGWDSFSSAVGIDGAVAEREVKGAVAFSVLVDDVRVAGPTIVRAGEAPVWITGVDLRGKKTLTLLADFADNYHFNGWAVWGGALLVRPLR